MKYIPPATHPYKKHFTPKLKQYYALKARILAGDKLTREEFTLVKSIDQSNNTKAYLRNTIPYVGDTMSFNEKS